MSAGADRARADACAGPAGSALALLARQHAHARWANRVLCAAIPDALEPALRQASHVLASEEIWLERIARGGAPTRDVFALDTPAGLTRRLDALELAWRAFFARVPAPDPLRRVEYLRLDGTPSAAPLADLLAHVVTHGAYHRGQIALCLREARIAVPPTDFVVWQRAHGDA